MHFILWPHCLVVSWREHKNDGPLESDRQTDCRGGRGPGCRATAKGIQDFHRRVIESFQSMRNCVAENSYIWYNRYRGRNGQRVYVEQIGLMVQQGQRTLYVNFLDILRFDEADETGTPPPKNHITPHSHSCTLPLHAASAALLILVICFSLCSWLIKLNKPLKALRALKGLEPTVTTPQGLCLTHTISMFS